MPSVLSDEIWLAGSTSMATAGLYSHVANSFGGADLEKNFDAEPQFVVTALIRMLVNTYTKTGYTTPKTFAKRLRACITSIFDNIVGQSIG